MADPIRQGVQDTIEDFHQAGIATIMLTGDQSPTAAVGGSLALQLLALMMPGLRALLGLTPLTLLDSVVVGASAILPLVVNEGTKGPQQRQLPRYKT